ncbi:peptidoglycan-binding protein [Streptomyces dangxiongensis]|uniref:Peptidoglycan-binding protein n=1 Tax=Streptomyces dangxiongensis TaxID=1442032 RepID=A0A3G2J711_9ACTN|nr:peptidoglycan-binding domain-containing protein [Streptomyces dangxiongensis]AYN38018.1 peptidoglycan-binding protein [Streptomyces dangxiongensis]
MPTPPHPEQPPPATESEPIHVLRLRRFDALAELMREFRPDPVTWEPSGTAPGPHPPPAEEDTRELPPVPSARAPKAPTPDVSGPRPARPAKAPTRGASGPGSGPPEHLRTGRAHLRRAVVGAAGGAVAAAALAGFGCALLLPGRQQAAAAPPAAPPSTASAPTTAAPPATASVPPPAATAPDPDGPGTLRQGDTGPPVTELQRRLLRVPDVYRDGTTSGTYDAILTEAVARFQLWYGISGDEKGVYGDDTRRALESRTGAGEES